MMTDHTGGEYELTPGAYSALQERETGNNTGHDSLPIGAVLRRLRGERTLRDVQRETGIANSYLCNVERGSQRPGLKFLGKMADYYHIGMADIIRQAELIGNNELDTQEARAANIERSYRFVMDDPKLRACQRPETPLSIEAKRYIVRMYELLTGRLILS